MNKTLLFLAFTAGAAFAADYQIDSAHSQAGFTVRHMMVTNVRGAFSSVAGKVSFDSKNPAASMIDATIDVRTVDTRDPKRDEHLKGADFFDTGKFPSMTFKSTSVAKAGKALKVMGDLTIKGVTKPVVLMVTPTDEVKDPYGNMRMGASATTKINRKDFGVNWNKTLDAGGVAVSDEVEITIDVALTRKPA
jgi:polyisoprenoid-binding protein YceI